MSIEPHLHYNQHKDYVEGFEEVGHEKSLKIANHVQVFMLRGVYKNWKQPVAYYFVNGAMKAFRLQKIIIDVIRKAKEAGLTVVSTVCDQGTNNKSAIDALVRDTQNLVGTQDYVFEVDGQRIIPLYDVPHLLKTMRNTLLSRDIHFTNAEGVAKVARWKDIEKVWELDYVSPEFRNLPRLTELHVNKSRMKKMKVSIAAQVLSHSVAVVLKLLHTSNVLEPQASGTVEFIELMDKLFDSVNGSVKINLRGKTLRTAVSIGNPDNEHFGLWKTALPILASSQYWLLFFLFS